MAVFFVAARRASMVAYGHILQIYKGARVPMCALRTMAKRARDAWRTEGDWASEHDYVLVRSFKKCVHDSEMFLQVNELRYNDSWFCATCFVCLKTEKSASVRDGLNDKFSNCDF